MDWKRKLSSRKLWMAVAGLVSGLVLLFGGTEDRAPAMWAGTRKGRVKSKGSPCSRAGGCGIMTSATAHRRLPGKTENDTWKKSLLWYNGGQYVQRRFFL